MRVQNVLGSTQVPQTVWTVNRPEWEVVWEGGKDTEEQGLFPSYRRTRSKVMGTYCTVWWVIFREEEVHNEDDEKEGICRSCCWQ
jgi:hypothetical protein